VLDEPTSALDATTEAALLDALERLVRGRTTLLIAHRLATLRLADEIVVLDRGRIVERGSHDTLLRDGRAYRRLWQAQTGRNVLGAELPAEP
jgi:ABC-type multidrug transport system fused ATPase/permease subunit